MNSERRSAYRVAMDGAAVRADVRGQGGQTLGDVLDLSLHGATICIGLDQQPTFFVGEAVTLRLNFERMAAVEVRATVESRTEEERSRRFGLSFANPAVLHAKLSAKLLRFFNERRAVRLAPAVTLPVEVQIPGQKFQTTGRMRDVSADGVGIVIDPESEQALSRVVQVGLKFTLPGYDRPLALQACIRNRSKLDDEKGVYLGLLFDSEDCSDFVCQQQRIADYVVGLQRDLLQELVTT